MSWVITPAYKTTIAVPDADANAYLQAVAAADGQGVEPAVALAVNNFVVGCKADGIWTAIKASCILAGARTLNGALVPLAGTAPTNVGPFVSGDYNRKTGLVGNHSTKYLNSNRAGNADPQNSISLSVYVTAAHNPSVADPVLVPFGGYIGNGGTGTGATQLFLSGGSLSSNWNTGGRSRNATADLNINAIVQPTGFIGSNRSDSAQYITRSSGINYTLSRASEASAADNFYVFARNSGSNTPQGPINGRLAFYSIGESLDLALLDARVTDLINAFGAAIP